MLEDVRKQREQVRDKIPAQVQAAQSAQQVLMVKQATLTEKLTLLKQAQEAFAQDPTNRKIINLLAIKHEVEVANASYQQAKQVIKPLCGIMMLLCRLRVHLLLKMN